MTKGERKKQQKRTENIISRNNREKTKMMRKAIKRKKTNTIRKSYKENVVK